MTINANQQQTAIAAPPIVDLETWQRERDALLVREKAHTKESDAIAAARRRLPMTEVNPVNVMGPNGPVSLLDVFQGRDELIIYKHMFHTGKPLEDQCEGCTLSIWHMHDASYLEARGVSYAVFSEGPWEESDRFREFMGYTVPWYSVYGIDDPIIGGEFGMFASFLREGDRVFLTGDITGRGTELAMVSLKLLDLSVYGRKETWEDSPSGWPTQGGPGWFWRKDGRPAPQWTRPGVTPVAPDSKSESCH
ncbi:DUF899 family protein [soil metagenome]